ncbi:MAG: hypothetical protein IT429_18330 [Gemmataceae bacterium]|nr:hypothetical protein [Gemmataceae bacterium]
MSRTTLCVLTAALLAVLSLGVMVARYCVLGDEVHAPAGPGTYKVTMVVRGKSNGDARLVTACPLDFRRQHISNEEYDSAKLAPRPTEGRDGERRQIQWVRRLGAARGPFQARYEFYCRMDVHRPSSPMTRLGDHLYLKPGPGKYVAASPGISPNDPDLCTLALDLTAGLDRPIDQARALFRFVDQEIANEPAAGGKGQTALECLQSGRGDAAGQSRLLVALCRSRAIPARLVTGLTLGKRNEQKAHTWVEAWVNEHWMPMCPFHHYCGRVPSGYLVFGFGDMTLVRGQNVRNLDYACLVEPRPLPGQETPARSALHHLFQGFALAALPPSERGLAEFLLLLPLAALVICLYRNLIGISSFGTFAPALIGLAFRDLRSLPGLVVFVSIVLIGWGMRRMLDRYHLLQVPRTAVLLTLVVLLLLTAIMVANVFNLMVTRYFSLFPMVILVAMIERFWTLETEDGTSSSFRTLFGTMLIAASISLLASLHAVVAFLGRYPEALGLLMAAQLLIGRYTGYRVSELFRFRDLAAQPSVRIEAATATHEPLTVVLPADEVAACSAK